MKEGNDFDLQHFTDVSVAFEITPNAQQIGSPMMQNLTLDYNFGHSVTMSFDNAVWKTALNCIESKTKVAIMVPQTEA